MSNFLNEIVTFSIIADQRGKFNFINMDHFDITLIWLGFFASIFFGWYFFLQARNKERLALIEKNADVSEIFKVRQAKLHFPWLKLGGIITGVGFGFCMALILSLSTDIHYVQGAKELMIIGFMLFFGGLGAVITYFIEKPKER